MFGGRGTAWFDFTSLLMRLPGAMASQTTGCIRYMNDSVEAVKAPPEQWAAKLTRNPQQLASLPMLARLLAPATDRFAQAAQRSHAGLRCAIAALAAERFRKKNNRWPESLDELKTAGLLKELPTDPYAGGPLKWKRIDDGVLIYAVGPDLKDDGGALAPDPSKAGTDFGFRLWDVTKRRQPAPPPKKPDDQP
jgi:hypothetical protein